MKTQPSTLTLLPAVDVADGQAVRLVQGAPRLCTAARSTPP
jgi:phosphoribosylformimino-5-aminoimidazole carboxamide ribonucleotide (ProFAR) isomerase